MDIREAMEKTRRLEDEIRSQVIRLIHQYEEETDLSVSNVTLDFTDVTSLSDIRRSCYLTKCYVEVLI